MRRKVKQRKSKNSEGVRKEKAIIQAEGDNKSNHTTKRKENSKALCGAGRNIAKGEKEFLTEWERGERRKKY